MLFAHSLSIVWCTVNAHGRTFRKIVFFLFNEIFSADKVLCNTCARNDCNVHLLLSMCFVGSTTETSEWKRKKIIWFEFAFDKNNFDISMHYYYIRIQYDGPDWCFFIHIRLCIVFFSLQFSFAELILFSPQNRKSNYMLWWNKITQTHFQLFALCVSLAKPSSVFYIATFVDAHTCYSMTTI